jgi:UDP-galactopyranose mutase
MDYLVVGAGLFGATFARNMAAVGKKCHVIDKRSYVGGLCATRKEEGIHVHLHGPHLFHTNDVEVWKFVNRFTEFNNYQHSVKASYKGNIYSLPFNMMTYNQLWGCTKPDAAKRIINKQRIPCENPKNLEEWALSQLGPDIYKTLIYGYTKKAWQREPRELPASLIKRLPLRYTYDENYFHDRFQGVPKWGYTQMVKNMLDHRNIRVELETDFFSKNWDKGKIVFTGRIDQLFDYEFGKLEYRTLKFVHQQVQGDYQGIGQLNYTDEKVPQIRIIEHKHFQDHPPRDVSIITHEYPDTWDDEKEPYYPINTQENNEIFRKYKKKLKKTNIVGGGRLFQHSYLDMEKTIRYAMDQIREELGVYRKKAPLWAKPKVGPIDTV